MRNGLTFVRMPVSLVWLLCCITASQETTRDHQETATCHQDNNSGDNCGVINDDDGKHKYKLHNNADPRFRGVYSFPVDPIPRRNCFDEEAMQFLGEGLPVVLDNCTFHSSALKWTIEYLKENLQDEDHTAYVSQTRKFLYYDDDLIKGAYKDFERPTTRRLLYFSNFTVLMEELEKADNGSRAYFQSLLYLQEGVSSTMLEDIDSFNYTWLLDLVRRVKWGEELTNMLLVGMHDVVTPAHFDILENLYVQIFGRKRVILFSPDYFRSLYPHPVGHPHDRQTQVDFDNPDLNRFPRFGEIRGMEVALEPGEVLYIPNYWWHYIESEKHSNTISVNFWFEPSNSSKNDSVKNSEELNDTSIETDKDEILEDKTPEGDNNDPADAEKTTQEDFEESNNSEQANENKEDIKESEIKSDANKERKDGESKREKEENEKGEEEEVEMELSAAKYLALLREAEMLLYRGTRSHEKVKKMLDELLSRRFDYI